MMDLDKLPQFPVQHEQEPWANKEGPPSRGEALSVLFEFSTGLALANLLVMGLLIPWRPVSALALLGWEAPLLFAVFGLLIVVSRMASLHHAADVAYDEGSVGETRLWAGLGGLGIAAGTALGLAMGIGFAFALAHLFGELEARGRPMEGPLDNLIAGAWIGALVGMVGGAGLTLAGGSPDWKAGRLFTALGALIPALLRSLVPKQRGEIQLIGKPWLEGIVWFALVAGATAWFLWELVFR